MFPITIKKSFEHEAEENYRPWLGTQICSKTRRKRGKISVAVTVSSFNMLFILWKHTEAGDGGGVVVDRHIVVEAAGALLQAEGQPAQPEDATWSSSYNPPAVNKQFPDITLGISTLRVMEEADLWK